MAVKAASEKKTHRQKALSGIWSIKLIQRIAALFGITVVSGIFPWKKKKAHCTEFYRTPL